MSEEAPEREPQARPVLNDRPEDDAAKQAEAVRPDTGGAIDADAAHDRSS
jgi:hypothetical protein